MKKDLVAEDILIEKILKITTLFAVTTTVTFLLGILVLVKNV